MFISNLVLPYLLYKLLLWPKCYAGNGVSNVSCCLAEKEIPILVKQEPVESKEPIIEADKSKSRYKKIIPTVPPSPVSRKMYRLVRLIYQTSKLNLTLQKIYIYIYSKWQRILKMFSIQILHNALKFGSTRWSKFLTIQSIYTLLD